MSTHLWVGTTDGKEWEVIQPRWPQDYLWGRPWGNDEAGFNWKIRSEHIVWSYEPKED